MVCEPHTAQGAPRKDDERKSLKSGYRSSVKHCLSHVALQTALATLSSETCHEVSIVWSDSRNPHHVLNPVLLFHLIDEVTEFQGHRVLQEVLEPNVSSSHLIPEPLCPALGIVVCVCAHVCVHMSTQTRENLRHHSLDTIYLFSFLKDRVSLAWNLSCSREASQRAVKPDFKYVCMCASVRVCVICVYVPTSAQVHVHACGNQNISSVLS